MNERIHELARQAGDYVNEVYTPPVRSKTPGKIWEDGHVDWHTQFNEKFAELIVKECAQVCRDQPNIYALKADRDNCAIAIEEHFGVQS
jgi:hypothetical protein